MRLTRNFALSLAAAGAAACSDGVGPKGNGPKTSISIDVCPALAQSWFAYQNEGGSWTRITPNSNSKLVFEATEKVSVATVMSAFGVSFTQIINATASDFQSTASALACDGIGDKVLNGSIAGVTGTQTVRISAASSTTGANAATPTWSMENLPPRPVDIIATRYASAFSEPSNRVLVRRGILPLNSTTPISALDFTGAESAAPEQSTATITGADANGSLQVRSSIITSTGTAHELGVFSSMGNTSSVGFVSVPAALRVTTDIHLLEAIASNAEGDRTVELFYKTPANKTLAFGPMVGTPTINVAGSAPYVRLRAQIASQSAYPTAMSMYYMQSTDGFDDRVITVLTTASFLGGTPQNWELTIPDMSAAGYDARKGLQSGEYSWMVTAFGGNSAAVVGGAPVDGATTVSASRYDPSLEASFSKRSIGSAPLFSRSRGQSR